MKCKDCGENLDTLSELPNGEKAPCPNCGSTARVLEVSIIDEIKVSDHTALLSEREGKSIGFRESVRDGRIAAADENDDGTFTYSMVGSSPQGEEDTISVCRNLVQVLNDLGGKWNDPMPGQGVIDCESTEPDTGRQLAIQVTRAIIERDFWEQLNRNQGFEARMISIDVLAKYLKNSIEKKAGDRAIPPDIRKDIILALDATRLPVFGLDSVIQGFKNEYGQWSKELGFDSIWLVGPQPDLVWRLDEE